MVEQGPRPHPGHTPKPPAVETPENVVVGRGSPDFLVVILDLDARAWQLAAQGKGPANERADAAFAMLQQAVSSVLVFLNAHCAMQHDNGLAVYGTAAGTARLFYSSSPHAATKEQRTQHTQLNTCLPFQKMDDAVFHGVRMLFEESSAGSTAPVGMVRALSLALCHIHRMTSMLSELTSAGQPISAASGDDDARASTRFRPTVLVLSATPDVSAQYVPMMNCIFSAQKQGIHIDVCKLLGEETVFLRQACHLTGGHYYRMPSLDGLLQVLMTGFLPSRSIRQLLMFPALDDVDFRAACFCHRRNVDIGYVCSVCLSSTLLHSRKFSASHARRALYVIRRSTPKRCSNLTWSVPSRRGSRRRRRRCRAL